MGVQRLGQAGAVALRLKHDPRQATDLFHVAALGKSLQGLTGGHAELNLVEDDVEFKREYGKCRLQLTLDALQSSLEAEPRIQTDHGHIQKLRDRTANLELPSRFPASKP